MKKIIILFFLLTSLVSWTQNNFSGVVTDALSGETIPSAVLVWGEKKDKGAVADINGKFSAQLPKGVQKIYFSAVGYEEQMLEVSFGTAPINMDVQLILINQRELLIVTDLAVGRKVPVAYSNIDMKRIDEELGGREMATLANTTPGAYATRAGGGDGDARVTIRGFSGPNVAVMLDGVPVNDMENGTVYWSNWFGLDLVTQTAQIQRGLGASKLVIPAVGGTMNIITRGIDQKRRIQVKQEFAVNAFSRTSFGMNTGKLKNGWAFSFAASVKDGIGWVEGTPTQGVFGFFKVEKKIKTHLLSFYSLGAPQRHGQRSRQDAIAMYDRETAEKLGTPTTFSMNSSNPNAPIFDGGINYNPDVGFLERYKWVNGEKVDIQTREMVNARENFYFKPQFSLKDVWSINDHSFLSTVVYMSIGKGGGKRWNSNLGINDYLPDGTVNIQEFYDFNAGTKLPPFSGPDYNINPLVSSSERFASSNYIIASMNEHKWTGALSTYSNQLNENFTISGGLDLRSYRGSHYRKIVDLMGADYIVATGGEDKNNLNLVKRVGDKIDYNNDALVRWSGVFGQVEYEDRKITAFISGSTAVTGYNRIDYFLPKVFDLDGKPVEVGYRVPTNVTNYISLISDTMVVDGKVLTSNMEGSDYQSTGWLYRNTYTVKYGFKATFDDHFSAFFNAGYLNKAPQFNQVYTNGNQRFSNIHNEIIMSNEVGLNWKYSKLALNVNAYYTTWENKPYPYGLSVPNPLDPSTNISVNVRGMNARHMGLEMDAAYKITDRLTLEVLASFADWIWTSGDTIYVRDDNGNVMLRDPEDPNSGPYTFVYDANGVHVSDAAQSQLGAMLRYEWKNGAYVKTRYTWFDRYFAELNPFTLNGANAGRESWRLPSYGTLELHTGYTYVTESKNRWDLRCSVYNLLNDKFITDATNNSTSALYNLKSNDFDAASAGVFFGQGRWFNVSLTATF
jgi:iron complex outermembrane receptor protein